jgi:hypothetical protein
MSEAIKDLIRRKAEAAGIDPLHALTMASIETGGTFNPGLTSPTGYKGLFQFGPSEWKAHGGGKDIFDPEANTDAFVSYHKEIKDKLKSALGREPTPQEMYLGWQQGASAVPALVNNPDQKVAGVLPAENILANGGTTDMTARDFANMWADKYGQHNAAITGSQYVRSVPPPAMQTNDNAVTVAATPPAAPTPTAPPGLLAQALKPVNQMMQNQQTAGLLAAGQPQFTPPAPLQMPGLLSPRVPNPNAVAMLPKRRGLLEG